MLHPLKKEIMLIANQEYVIIWCYNAGKMDNNNTTSFEVSFSLMLLRDNEKVVGNISAKTGIAQAR